MAHVAPIYPNFSRGEVSPLMFGRIDIEQYPSCLDKCRNMYIRPYGCASRLSGTEFVANAKNNGKARLLKFVFSPTDSYIIECGAGYFRFYQDGGAVLKTDADAWETGTAYKAGDFVRQNDLIYYCIRNHTSSVFEDDIENGDWVQQDIYEVPNDYYEDQLDSIQYVQLDDIIKLACLPHGTDNTTARPKELIRNSSSDWIFRDVAFVETPYLDQNTTSITMTPSAVTGNITITASSSYFNAQMVGANMWIGTKVTDTTINKDIVGYVQITGYTSATQVNATVKSKLSGTTATKLWGEGAFSDYRGYPAVVALYDGRIYYARTPLQPRNIYGSKPYSYETFTPAVDNEADAGINIALATNANGDGSDIKWMIGASYLLCGTYGGEFVIRGSSDGAITATDISARQRTNWGGEPVQPIVAGTFVHFLQRNGNKLRQFQYDYYYDAYKAVDVSIFSEHLLESPIKQMALQKNPDSIIYLMREDGRVVMLTLEQDQSVQAWSLLEEMGASVESIQTIPSFDGNYDEVYLLMLRQGLATTLTFTCSNPNLSIQNNYYGTKSEIGIVNNTITCDASKYNVKTYNNAVINEQGELSGFSGSTVSFTVGLVPNGSTAYYFKPSSSKWEMVFAFTTGGATASGNYQYITSTNTADAGVEIGITSANKFRMRLSKDGTTSGYIGTTATQTGTHDVQTNTNYLVKLSFSGNQYKLEYSLDDGENWTTDVTLNSTAKVLNNERLLLGCYWGNKTYSLPFLGTINLNKCYIKINNEITWTGAETYWKNEQNQEVLAAEYGIIVSGIPEKGDTINLTYTTIPEAPVRYIERMKSLITPKNRNDWWYVRSGLQYDAYSLTDGNDLTLSGYADNITITSDSAIFDEDDIGKYLRTIDGNGEILGEGEITAVNSSTSIELSVTTNFENSIIQGGKWGMSITSISGLTHLENKIVQTFADGYMQEEKRVESGNITLDKPSYKVLVGLPYQSYITTMPMEAGSQNGTAVGKRKRISEMAIRVWNTLGAKVGRSLDKLYDTIYKQTEPYTGVIPNIKYNQGWVWDANITVEQSRPYPMNILSIAPIVTEVDK